MRSKEPSSSAGVGDATTIAIVFNSRWKAGRKGGRQKLRLYFVHYDRSTDPCPSHSSCMAKLFHYKVQHAGISRIHTHFTRNGKGIGRKFPVLRSGWATSHTHLHIVPQFTQIDRLYNDILAPSSVPMQTPIGKVNRKSDGCHLW